MLVEPARSADDAMKIGRPYSFAPNALIHAPHFAERVAVGRRLAGRQYSSAG